MSLEITNGKIISVSTIESENIEYSFIKYQKEDRTESHYPLLYPIQKDVKHWIGKYLQVRMDGTKKIEEITDKPIPTDI
jgi:hypothetical protein